MTHVVDASSQPWTAVELAKYFGPISLDRIRTVPTPGTATEEDVVRIHDREDRLFELVDGVLVEKTVGTYESYLASELARLLGNYSRQNDKGIVLGADGMLRIAPKLVRIPDVSFIAWQRLPNRRIPRQSIAELVPDLAVEVISRGNTREEMDRKMQEYFAAGVRLVWYVYPNNREVHVYSSPERVEIVSYQKVLEGGDVLPGLAISLNELFSESEPQCD